MRTIKELLQLMLDNKRFFSVGLCRWSRQMYYQGIINYREHSAIRDYIGANRPSKWSSFQAFEHKSNVFYWKPHDITYRIKWLKKHIAKNS